MSLLSTGSEKEGKRRARRRRVTNEERDEQDNNDTVQYASATANRQMIPYDHTSFSPLNEATPISIPIPFPGLFARDVSSTSRRKHRPGV